MYILVYAYILSDTVSHTIVLHKSRVIKWFAYLNMGPCRNRIFSTGEIILQDCRHRNKSIVVPASVRFLLFCNVAQFFLFLSAPTSRVSSFPPFLAWLSFGVFADHWEGGRE